MDWKEQVFSFVYEGNRVTLLGEKALNCMKFYFKSLKPVYTSGKIGREVLLASSIATSLFPEVRIQYSQILQEFADVFSIPTTLPSFRGQRHTINLKPGVSSVSVRPCRYPHASKVAMEQMGERYVSYGYYTAKHKSILKSCSSSKEERCVFTLLC